MRLELANNSDLVRARHGDISGSEVRRYEVDGIVDTGAAHMVLPGAAMDALGLPQAGTAKVRYADGHAEIRPVIKNVWLRVCDRDSVFSAVVEPNRETALIGAIVLEELDLIVDCATQNLAPRDPQRFTSVIE